MKRKKINAPRKYAAGALGLGSNGKGPNRKNRTPALDALDDQLAQVVKTRRAYLSDIKKLTRAHHLLRRRRAILVADAKEAASARRIMDKLKITLPSR